MATEKDIERLHILEASKNGLVLFKNNVGVAFKEYNGKKHVIRFGLCDGSSDLIGITPVEITPDMVGKRIAVFTAIEIKKDVTKKYDKDRMESQQRFIDMVKRFGGISFKSDNAESMIAKIKNWYR